MQNLQKNEITNETGFLAKRLSSSGEWRLLSDIPFETETRALSEGEKIVKAQVKEADAQIKARQKEEKKRQAELQKKFKRKS